MNPEKIPNFWGWKNDFQRGGGRGDDFFKENIHKRKKYILINFRFGWWDRKQSGDTQSIQRSDLDRYIQLFDRLIRLIDRLIDWLINRLINKSINRWIDWCIDGSNDRWIDWTINWWYSRWFMNWEIVFQLNWWTINRLVDWLIV